MKRWAIIIAVLSSAAGMLPGTSEAQEAFNECRTVCRPDQGCRMPCTECAYSPDGYCIWPYQTTCGGAGYSACPIGYGQGGSIFYSEYCAGSLVPHNVDPTPPSYPPAPDGEFSCWGNTPDVICYSVPPIYGYINVRRCYMGQDYGCHDCTPE
jgi:hypothetical protein